MDAKASGKQPFISIIIPHYNGKQHLQTCFDSLRRQSYTKFEVILVDNNSTDGSQDYVREWYPEVRLVALDANLGFTGACNAGYEASEGDLIILLNNDTEADEQWLSALVATFTRIPEAASVASKMLLFEERSRLHTAGDFYRVDGIPGNRGVWQEDQGQYDQECFVFSACGGAAAYRKDVIDEIGFLDDDFFFSCEDIDLAWRIHLSGYRVAYTPAAVVYHKLKASAGAGPTSSYFDGRNFLYVIWKNYPSSLLRKYWPQIVRAQLSISQDAMRAWRGAAARARLRGQIAGLWGFFKMLPKRRLIQKSRRIDDQSIEALLTPVDESP